MRKGFEDSLLEIKMAFAYLLDYNFTISGETNNEDRVSIGYKGGVYNILLSYEFLAENFDFVLIDAKNPYRSIQLWKILDKLDPSFDYFKIKPNLTEYKSQLVLMSEMFRRCLPILMSENIFLT